jgi:hypothetical protein
VSAARTPTPWSVDGEHLRALVRGADGTIVALRHRLPAATHVANAEFICRAVNAHDDLVAAVKLVRSIIGEAAPEGFNPLVGDWAARLFLSQHDTHAALTKAEGRS